jgi:hypothetical protein
VYNSLFPSFDGILGYGGTYENTFRTSFIKCLYNQGKGLVVSSEYFHPDKASRKYTNKSDPALMEKCRQILKSLKWEDKLTNFEEIEMDCVLRCHDLHPGVEEFADPAKILLPKKPFDATPPPFAKKISDNSIDGELPEPNSYIVVEIGSNSKSLPQKLQQLEKDLRFLLLRHQNEQGNELATIESIIRYAFLVIPYSPMKKTKMDELISTTILKEKDFFPLLYRIFEIGRFARFFTPAGMKAMITEMSNNISENTSSTHERSVLSLEKKRKIEKLKFLTEQLIAGRLLISNPEVQKRVALLEQELASLIIEENPLSEDD